MAMFVASAQAAGICFVVALKMHHHSRRVRFILSCMRAPKDVSRTGDDGGRSAGISLGDGDAATQTVLLDISKRTLIEAYEKSIAYSNSAG